MTRKKRFTDFYKFSETSKVGDIVRIRDKVGDLVYGIIESINDVTYTVVTEYEDKVTIRWRV